MNGHIIQSCWRGVLSLILVSALLIGCDRLPFFTHESGEKEDAVARVGDINITADELQWYLESRSESGMPIVDENAVRARLDELITTRLIAEETRRQLLATDPSLRFAVDQMLGQHLLTRKVVEPAMRREISEEEIADYYREHEDEYSRPRQVRLADIFIAVQSGDTSDLKNEKQKKAQQILDTAIRQQDERFGFSNLVKRYSDQPSSYPMGDTGYFDESGKPAKLDPILVKKAFELDEKGRVFEELIETADGFHIVMLISSRDAVKTDLDTIRPQIEQRIRRAEVKAGREAFINSLSADATVEIDARTLDQVSRNYLELHKGKTGTGSPGAPTLPGS